MGTAASEEDLALCGELVAQAIDIYREVDDAWGLGNALSRLGQVRYWQGKIKEAQRLYEQSLTQHDRSGDRRGQALPCHDLGNIAWDSANYPAARTFYKKALRLWNELEEKWGMALTLARLGLVAAEEGDYSSAYTHYQQALEIFQESGHKHYIGAAFLCLAELERCRADYQAARKYIEETLALASAHTPKSFAAEALGNLGWVAVREGHLAEARTSFQQALQQAAAIPRLVAPYLAGVAAVALGTGRPARAGRLLGLLETLRTQDEGRLLRGANRLDYERTLTTAHALSNEATFATAWTAGQALTLEEAIAYALDPDD